MTDHFARPSRRQFIGLLGGGVLATLLGGRRLAQTASAQSIRRVHVQSYNPAATATAAAVRQAFLSATDLSWLHQGDSVFVKVASNSNYGPPSVTSPDVLQGVVGLLKEAGAGDVYVGDMSGAMFVRHLAEGSKGSTRDNLRANGLLEAAESAGALIHCFDEVPFETAYVPGVVPGDNHWGDELHVAEILDRVDHVVNLPRLGKHVLAGASLGLKNAVGWISDHSRMVLHRDAASFHMKIAEINAIPQLADKTRLTLTLVDRALTTYGPDSGYSLALAQPLIVASDDVVSHDQIALMTLLWARGQTPRTALDEDPYPAQSNGLNWWFVRVTWGESASETLPVYDDLAAVSAPTHINYAYNILQGGRPDRIEIVPGGLPLAEDFVALLDSYPDLRIAVRDLV
ncbi:MAG: DUF362 domain-containing protein [Anaerolineae bacterium]|nr:DUF362 domain-containing protein [Anaerolineae bacterium]